MTGFEASNSIQPQRNKKNLRVKYKSLGSYLVAVIILFITVILMCANNYNLLRSYQNLKNELLTAYTALDGEYARARKIETEKNDILNKYTQLEKEIEQLRDNYNKTSRGSDDLRKQLEELIKKNDELSRQVSILSDDNIALQNTIKMAASVGIKPQNYTLFEGLKISGTINRGKYIGKFLGTAYTPSKEECGNDMGITKSGKPVIPGISVAIDNKYWPFGTVFYIKGLGYTIAMDTGSAIKGKYRFDISVLDKEFAKKLGSRKWDVYLVKMGNGKVNEAILNQML